MVVHIKNILPFFHNSHKIEYDKIDKLRGMNISITTTAKTDEEAKALLSAFHFPFRN